MLLLISLTITHKVLTNKEIILSNNYEVIVDSKYDEPQLIMAHNQFTLSPNLLDHIDKIEEVPNDIEETISHIKNISDDLKNGRQTFMIFFSDKLSRHSEHKFFVSSDKEMALRVCNYFPGLYVYNASENAEYKLALNEYSEKIALRPIFSELTSELLVKFEETKLPKFYLFYDKIEQLNGFRDIVFKYRNSVNVGHLVFKKEGSLKHVGIDDNNMPAIVTIVEGVKYSEKDLDKEKLDTFLHKYINNEILPFEMSEDEIEESDEVLKKHRITRKMYKEGDYKNSLIFFVSKNCGFCTQIKPVIKELIELNKSKVKICIVDGTKNDFSEFKVRGYPTIAYKDEDDIKYFEGERKVERFVEFVKKNSKEEIDMNQSDDEKNDL